MRQRIYIAAAILALIAAAGLYSMYRSIDTSVEEIVSSGNPVVGIAENDSDPFDTVIRFDGENFIPKELTVKKGTRVRILNESDEGVWPASAIHPTHSLYPENAESNCLGSSFDACDTLQRGEFFDFTFNYAGEWRYHDHIRAFKTGVITVIE